MALITLADIQAVREISASVKPVKINQYIEDAQFVDLKPLLGEKQYFDLVKNSETVANVALLTGGDYVHVGFTYQHPGIKAVLIDFAFARYRFFGPDTDTPMGSVIKQNMDGKSTGRDRDKEVFKALQQTAMEKWADVERFLNRKSSDYPYWGADLDPYCPPQNTNFRISKITL